MVRKVIIDVPEFNRFFVTVEGRDIEEIKRNALEAVDRGEWQEAERGVGGISQVAPYIHPIKEEEFFHDPDKKIETEQCIGVAEKFGGSFCVDCDPRTGQDLPDGWIYLIEPFTCTGCGKEIK